MDDKEMTILDMGEMIKYIAEKLNIDEALVEKVMECEDEFMVKMGIATVYED